MISENEIGQCQTDSECESDLSSSVTDCSKSNFNEKTSSDEHLIKRFDSLTQENRVLRIELQTFKLRLKSVDNEIKQLKLQSVNLQAKAEQEEEFISNTLFKKIDKLKKEKESLANNFEREEEFLTNDLSKKLQKIREEKYSLEESLEKEQSSQINNLLKRIQRLEAETTNKQNILEKLKKEKIDLENTLEKEQESLVNRLWKRMEKLENEKKILLLQIEEPQRENLSIKSDGNSSEDVEPLRREIEKLQRELISVEEVHQKKIEEILSQEKNARTENLRLQRKLQLEIDRREELYRQWSESESSLEMDEERALNQKMKFFYKDCSSSSSSSIQNIIRCRTSSTSSFDVPLNNDSINEIKQRKSSSSVNFEKNHQNE